MHNQPDTNDESPTDADGIWGWAFIVAFLLTAAFIGVAFALLNHSSSMLMAIIGGALNGFLGAYLIFWIGIWISKILTADKDRQH